MTLPKTIQNSNFKIQQFRHISLISSFSKPEKYFIESKKNIIKPIKTNNMFVMGNKNANIFFLMFY
jgi:hypothetical protein